MPVQTPGRTARKPRPDQTKGTPQSENVTHVNIYQRARDGTTHAVYGPAKRFEPQPHPSTNGPWVGKPHGHIVKKNGVTQYHRTVDGRIVKDTSKR